MASFERARYAAARVIVLVAWTAVACAIVYTTPAGEALNATCNRWVAATNSAILRALSVDSSVDGNYIHTATFSVLIVDRCNGLMAMVLLVPACLTLPCRMAARALAAICGIVLISIFNQLRLVVEMLFGSLYPQYYDALETYYMRGLFALVFLLGFIGWAQMASRPKASPSS